MKAALDEGKHVRFLDWSDKEIDILNKHLFLTAKPMIYLLNMSKKEYIKKKSKWLMPIKQKVNISLENLLVGKTHYTLQSNIFVLSIKKSRYESCMIMLWCQILNIAKSRQSIPQN